MLQVRELTGLLIAPLVWNRMAASPAERASWRCLHTVGIAEGVGLHLACLPDCMCEFVGVKQGILLTDCRPEISPVTAWMSHIGEWYCIRQCFTSKERISIYCALLWDCKS